MHSIPFALCLALASMLAFASDSRAQTITLPPNGDNQRSEVTQYIGSIANIHVRYNSPDVTARAARIAGAKSGAKWCRMASRIWVLAWAQRRRGAPEPMRTRSSH